MKLSRSTFLMLVLLVFLAGMVANYNYSLRPAFPGKIDESGKEMLVWQSSHNDPPRPIAVIAGLPVTRRYQATALADHFFIGDTLPIQFRNGEVREIILQPAYRLREVLMYFFLGMTFLAISLLVFFYGKEQTEQVFALSGLCFSYILSAGWSGAKLPGILGEIIVFLYYLAYPQAFALFYYFGSQFPSRSIAPTGLRRRFLIGQTLAVFFTVLLSGAFFYNQMSFSLQSIELYQTVYRLFRLAVILAVSAALFNIYRNARRQPNPVNRRKALWVFWGALWSGLPFFFLWSFPQLWGPPLIPEWLAHLFIFFLPVMLLIAITRYRLFDIELVISRSLTYSLLFGSLIVGYLIISGTVSLLVIQRFSLQSPYISIFAALLLALLFQPLRQKTQEAIDRRFFRIRYDRFRALQAFLTQIESAAGSSRVVAILEKSFQQLIPLRRQHLLHRPSLKIKRDGWLSALTAVGKLYANIRQLSRLESPDLLPSIELPEQYVLAANLGNGWFWLLGEKASGTRFWKEDLELAGQMAVATASQLEKRELWERAWREEQQKEAARRESRWRSLLLAELAHDLRAPLNNLLWKLYNLREELPKELPDLNEMERQINRSLEFIQSLLTLAGTQREKTQLPFQALPVALPLKEALEHLEVLIHRKDLKIRLELEEGLQVLAVPLLLREVLQNLLQNAAKFSPESGTITISGCRTIRRKKASAHIRIQDEGPGLSKTEVSENESATRGKNLPGFHFGLEIVREFVKLLRGEARIKSRRGKGTTVDLFFRIPENQTK